MSASSPRGERRVQSVSCEAHGQRPPLRLRGESSAARSFVLQERTERGRGETAERRAGRGGEKRARAGGRRIVWRLEVPRFLSPASLVHALGSGSAYLSLPERSGSEQTPPAPGRTSRPKWPSLRCSLPYKQRHPQNDGYILTLCIYSHPSKQKIKGPLCCL